ncbi:MAG: hypothetical protein EKK54_03075 [Neisseriaceae bacterium]|nr:MAG: hypothetical protein EKK54_03075 [Neisseriaceae bacterium]
MNKQILVILEGKKPDLAVINKISALLDLKLSVQIIFGANIYELYRSIHDDEFTKIEDLSFGINTFDLIKESGSETFKDYNHTFLQEYTAQDFAFIYLFFDFDPWSATESIPLSIVKNMLELFNEPTEQGKLYVNYPSIESFNHITDNFQYLYYHYQTGGDSYKNKAGKYIPEFKQYNQIKKINRSHLLELIRLHLQKANFICNNAFVVPDDIAEIEQVHIFDKQFIFYNQEQKTYVLSSIPLFLFELYGFERLKSLLSN